MHVPSPAPVTARAQRWLAAGGAVSAAAAVALSAYAAHAVDGPAQARLQTAAVFAFGHGLALALLAPATGRRLGRGALLALCLGVVLFCGSVVMGVLAQWPTTLAPLGGLLLIGGWLLLALDLSRR